MINIVLDTHTFIWLVEGDGQINKPISDFLNNSSIRKRLFIPSIVLWEVCMLEKKERIHLSFPSRLWIERALSHPNMELLPLSPEIAYESCNLPGNFHGDPSDRLIVASARCEDMYLYTHDKAIKKYAAEGYVELFDSKIIKNP